MTPCSDAVIDSDLHKLQEVRLKLSECLSVLRADDVGRTQIAMALSFVQLAIDALMKFKFERAPLA
jgi:hypothetical protein